MRRVVAVLGAVLMVGVALLIRGGIGGDDSDGGGSDGGGGGADPIALVCIEELQAVCEAMERDGAIESFDQEAAGVTVDRLGDGEELGADGWLTLDPFPEIADTAGDVAGNGRVFGEVVHSERSAALAIAAHPDRVTPIEDVCPDVTWECVLDVAGEPWTGHGQDLSGAIELGVPDPAATATGLLLAAQVVGELAGDSDFASNDFVTSEVTRALRTFDESSAGDPLTAMITRGVGQFALVGALGNDAESIGETERGEGIGIFYPAPMYRAEVVLAAPGGSAEDLLDDDALDDALAAEGWSGDEIATSLPESDVLYALREEF